MDRAADMLKDHEVNCGRRERGEPEATNIWLWGQGRPTPLESFASRFGCSGVVITGVDIIRGLALSMGMWLLVLVPWVRDHEKMAPDQHQQGMYKALGAWAITDIAVIFAFAV